MAPLFFFGGRIFADIPRTAFVQDEVLVAGFGRKGHAVGDIPGVRFKVRHEPAVPILSLRKMIELRQLRTVHALSASVASSLHGTVAAEILA